ncbi:MAG: hypothetical protein D6759_12475 [Chloroflexi bacterium]|nr:MAG: hypothetical protein D6759_12475 [Chloroflexota bacterium]
MEILNFPRPLLSIFGEDFVAGTTGLVILALGFLVDAGTGVCGAMVNMTGHSRLSFVNSVAMVIVTLGLDLWLIPRWGVTGAATAAAGAIALVNFLRLTEVYALYRIFPYNRDSLKPLAAALVTALIIWPLSRWGGFPSDLVRLGAGAAALSGVYIAATIGLGLSEEDRLVLSRVQRRFVVRLSPH